MNLDPQDQIYIVSAALVVVTVVLLIFCIALCVSVRRLKTIVKEQRRKDFVTPVAPRESQYAYNNPSIQPDEELHHRGYLMHQGQFVPRVISTSNGGYSTDPPRKSVKPTSEPNNSSRDFVPINDRNGSKDVSKDFRAVMNPKSSVFDDDLSYNNEILPVSSKVPITVNNGNSNRYTPPRPSQFNSNITLAQGQSDSRQDGVTYFNNRAINY